MSTPAPGFYRDVARVPLGVTTRYGFALGGGLAWVTHGLVDRPTEDIDLFADVDGAAGSAADEVRDALVAARFEVEERTGDGGRAHCSTTSIGACASSRCAATAGRGGR